MGPQIVTEDLVLIIYAGNQRCQIFPQFFRDQLKALHHRLSNIFAGGVHDEKSATPVTAAAEHNLC
jgi:hypothetical protein